MSGFASQLGDLASAFLKHKRTLGIRYRREEGFLREFDHFAAERRESGISEPLVREYLSRRTRGSRSHHLTLVRQFAQFVQLQQPDTFVPPPRFLGIRRSRPVIRVLSREESARFLDACSNLPSSPGWPDRGCVLGPALRLLLLTGLRRSELLDLEDRDVDLKTGVLTIRCGKFSKSRFVPLADEETDRLRAYRTDLLAREPGRMATDAFFPRRDGHRRCSNSSLYRAFRRVLRLAGIQHHGRGEGPRLHDLRHSFAVLRMFAWYEQGQDLRAKLPLLATYLGHVGVSTSQVYLHMTQDLAEGVTRRHEQRFGHLITAAPEGGLS
ncbi:MAG: tyrosine-type recombinase/integrase [Myxococcota bacterium]